MSAVWALLLLHISAAWFACAAPSAYTSNWAVIVSTSRHWLNYRHSANALAMYRVLKRFGFPDSNIILMLSDDHACNPRNPYKAQVFNHESHSVDVYGSEVEVDYRGYEVTVENFLRVLTGRHAPLVPRTQRLLSDENSNVLIYLTGHGGDGFVKFSDTSELMAQDLADAMEQMSEKKRYNQVLLMVDSCEAHTQVKRITAPRVIALASSVKGESAFAYKNDYALGQAVSDRFSHLTLEWARGLPTDSQASLADMIQIYSYAMMESHLGVHVTHGLQRNLSEIRATEFLGSVTEPQISKQAYPLPRPRPQR